MQPLQGGEALLDLAEFNLDSPQAVVQPAHIGSDPGDLDAQGDGRSDNGTDDPLRVAASSPWNKVVGGLTVVEGVRI